MIITKEAKEIALGMWESIRDDWLKNPDDTTLRQYKQQYLKRFGYAYKWDKDCLLCEYYSYYADGSLFPYSACLQCPLDSCTESNTAYYRVLSAKLPLQVRIDACNEIIRCIEDIEVEQDETL